jgi:hypothetical protein
MDNKQLIHMACEGLVIGGVVLYFSKQMKTMNKEIEDLKSIIAKNQAANEKRFEVIFNFLDNVNGGFMPPQHQPPPPQQSRVQTPQVKKTPPSKVKTVKFEEEELEPRPLPSKKKVQPQQKEVVKKEVVKDEIEKLKEMQEECDPETEVCNNDVTDIEAEINMLNNEEDIEESVEDSLDE